MTFIEKWATSAFVVALPVLWALAAAQHEANVLGEMPPLSAWLAAFVMLGFAAACVWQAASREH